MLAVFPTEKRYVSRELVNYTYPTSSYFISRVLAELPAQILLTSKFTTFTNFVCCSIRCLAIFCAIVYWSVHLNPDPIRFLIFIGVVILVTLTAMATGI